MSTAKNRYTSDNSSSQTARRPLLVITVDSDAEPDGRLSCEDSGIEYIMNIADNAGVKITVFLNYLNMQSDREATVKFGRRILWRGHDLQPMAYNPCIMDTGRQNENLLFLTDEGADELICGIVSEYMLCASKKPISFRAGGFELNPAIIRALKKHKIPIDSSYCPLLLENPSCRGSFNWDNGVLELPVSTSENSDAPVSWLDFGSMLHFARTAGIAQAVEKCGQFLSEIISPGVADTISVFRVSSSSFFKHGVDGEVIEPDNFAFRFFETVLDKFSSITDFTTMSGIAQLMESGCVTVHTQNLRSYELSNKIPEYPNIDEMFASLIHKHGLWKTTLEFNVEKNAKLIAERINDITKKIPASAAIALGVTTQIFYFMRKKGLLHVTPKYIIDSNKQRDFVVDQCLRENNICLVESLDGINTNKLKLDVVIWVNVPVTSVEISVKSYEIPQKGITYRDFNITEKPFLYRQMDHYRNQLHLQPEDSEVLYKRIIGVLLSCKDFRTAEKYMRIYIGNRYAGWESYWKLLYDIAVLLHMIFINLSSKKNENIVYIILDGWAKYYLDNTDTLKTLCDESLLLTNFHCTAAYTTQSFYSIFSGKLFCETQNADFGTINVSNSPLFNLMAQNGFSIKSKATISQAVGRIAHLLKRSPDDNHLFGTPPVSICMWDVLAELCSSSEKSFIITHAFMEVHDRYNSGHAKPMFYGEDGLLETKNAWLKSNDNLKDEKYEKYMSVYRQMAMNSAELAYRQILFYISLFNFDSTAMVLSADHGRNFEAYAKWFDRLHFYNYYSKDAYNIPMLIRTNRIKPDLYDGLLSYTDFAAILSNVLHNQDNIRLPQNEWIKMAELPMANSRYLSFLPSYEAAKDSKMCGCLIIHTLADKYMLMADGSESYYLLPNDYRKEHDLINSLEHQNRIQYLRSKVIPNFWDKFWNENLPGYDNSKKKFLEPWDTRQNENI